ncbi:RbsD/FucU family protein [Methylobrevis albus]|uniref:RbsD/FucU family protein n=1 Tax=Methylobrevis albus TaxID=2793297 RepID=A0A931MWS7_9HYPH|nr:RbsD/FucU family protein [Methylobrevis albus]MBH0237743.1 RbsD/FucU family protein [Methylobrevis albus]
MLKGIDPRLNPELLHVLAAMGHGDDLVICDTNFPADSVARQTVWGRPLRIDGADSATAVAAVLSLFPLDSFVDSPVSRMEVVGEPDTVTEVQREVQQAVDAAEGAPTPIASIERFAFYEAAKKAYAVLVTGELRFYGCFILKKGVIPPPAS